MSPLDVLRHRGAMAYQLLIVVVAGVGACGGGTPVARKLPPVISSFAASPSWVTIGQSATLRWTVDGATTVRIDPIGPVTGSNTPVTPAADITYVLTASNQYGSVSAQVPVAVFPPPTLWFAPVWDNTQAPPYGASDYFALFSPNAPWANAALHVSVFKIYAHMLDIYDSATLRNMLADLKRRHIALAIEWGALEPVDSCDWTEGFDFRGSGLHYATRIRDLGGTLQYVAFDEPFQHTSSLYQGPGACLWSAQQIAQYVARDLAQIQSIFPDVVVGDIEVLPDFDSVDNWLGPYQQWLDAWEVETGKPFAFFHFDIAWTNDWKSPAAALARALRARNIPVGQIYIGDADAGTDASWIASALQHTADVEISVGLKPDQVIFQSWEPRPMHALPETDPTAFTYVIDRYFRDRTQLTLNAVPGAAEGQLTGPAGPIAQATIDVTAKPLSGNGQVAAYQHSDTAPTGTQSVVFGARVGMEGCELVGTQSAEFTLTDFALDAGAAGQLSDDFVQGLSGWGSWGTAAAAQVQGTSLNVLVQSGQSFGLNSLLLPLSASGTTYTFTVHATIPSGSVGGGCAIAAFMDAGNAEITRVVMPLVPLTVRIGAVPTDGNGRYSAPLGSQPDQTSLTAEYAGSDTWWPSGASSVLGPQAVPVIVTTSLPDGAVGNAYSQTLVASGGIEPYLWVAGRLPRGLTQSQDGTLSGTPTTAGTYTLSLSVVDHATSPQAADASLQLVIH